MLRKIKALLAPEDVKRSIPTDDELSRSREECVKQIKNILDGKDDRKIFIVGPCSADDGKAVCEYARRLKDVAEKVKDKLLVIVRVYTAKPRSRGEGYMGMIHTPDPSGDVDFTAGIAAARKLHIDVMRESGLCTADEIVYPDLEVYFSDLVSYQTVGARTAQDPMHRFIASGLDIPVGIKNPVGGNIGELSDSIHAARKPHEFVFCGNVVRSTGNEYVHAILRGGVDLSGKNISNYGIDDVLRLNDALGGRAAAIIDTGHSNSGKDISKVEQIVQTVIKNAELSDEYARIVKGFMAESYLVDGCAQVGTQEFGQSITDSCIGFEKTERLLLSLARAL